MKRKIIMFTACIMLLCLLAGCTRFETWLEKEPRNQIYQLEIYSAIENDEMIYHIKYPYYYFGFNNESMGKTTLYEFQQAVDRTEVDEETFRYLRDYVLGLGEEDEQETSVLAYEVCLSYYDEAGEEKIAYAIGYDDFPKDFEVFIDKVNKICGKPYLKESGDLQEVTPAYLNEIWGVTDEDVPGGTLMDLIENNEIDIKALTDLFDLQNEINTFYADGKSSLIDPYRPLQLVEKESSGEEYEAFVIEFARCLSEMNIKLKEDGETTQDQNNMIRYNSEFYIAKTSDLSRLEIKEPSWEGGYYQIVLDAHMEEMTMNADFIYSKDAKYILIGCNNVDIQEAFVQCDVMK